MKIILPTKRAKIKEVSRYFKTLFNRGMIETIGGVKTIGIQNLVTCMQVYFYECKF